jgi:hypothetical protein
MKKLTIILSAVIVLLSCTSNNGGQDAQLNDSTVHARNTKMMADSANFTTMEWLDKGNDSLPKIKEGEVLEVNFKFKNTGKKPLVITNVSASCGCTVPETPKKAFAPGEEGEIRAKFDSHGKMGLQEKAIFVTANTTPQTFHQRSFRVEVTQ